MLQVEGLTKRFGSKLAVDGLSFSLAGGQVVGFLGPNGAGKTTTLRMLTGLSQPTAGDVRMGEYNVLTQLREATTQYGYVPDSPFLFPKLTGAELLRFVAVVRGIAEDQVGSFLSQWRNRFELAEYDKTYLDQCSLGTKRKWAILTALLHKPRILLLDEPLNGLDPKSVRTMKDMFLEFKAAGGLVFMSTHLLDVVSAVCDSVMVINHGRLVLPCTSLDQLPSLEETFLRLTDNAAATKEKAVNNKT